MGEKLKTQSEVRKEKFDVKAEAAKKLGNTALEAIDHALAEQDEAFERLDKRVKQGLIDEEEAEKLYYNWITTGRSMDPEDSLATPFVYEQQRSLWE